MARLTVLDLKRSPLWLPHIPTQDIDKLYKIRLPPGFPDIWGNYFKTGNYFSPSVGNLQTYCFCDINTDLRALSHPRPLEWG